MDIEFYRRTIAEAFPRLAIKDIELDCSGWDNVVVIVNREIIFRFPRRLEATRTLETERRLLPELAKVVSLPIPHFEFVTSRFVGYRLIPGEPLTKELFQELHPTEKAYIARELSDFLTKIHSFPIERAIELGVPHTPDRELWANFYADIQQHVFPLLTAYERQWAQELFETFLGDERNFRFTPVLLHGDVNPDHILFDRKTKRITGIIDFGDMRIGDRAYEFQLREDWGEAFLRELLAQYEENMVRAGIHNAIDERFFQRLEFYERRQPLGEILYGVTCGAPEHVAAGLQTVFDLKSRRMSP